MSLEPGSTSLPHHHISARIPWHDTDWTGRICIQPGSNYSCTILPSIQESKDPEAEEARAGEPWPQFGDKGDFPPCVLERGGFMRPESMTVRRTHPLAWTEHHKHFAPTDHVMPAYSLEAVPYRWTQRELAPDLAQRWGIELDESLEKAIDETVGYKSGWIQHHLNQRRMLDSFFSALRPQQSLAFIYAKDVPLLEDQSPGSRVLVGVGRVTRIDPSVEWLYSSQPDVRQLRAILWERGVHHSIRPSGEDGFLLPYQTLLANPRLAGEDLAPFVALTSDDHFEQFSYAAELVDHDAAIAALLELDRVVSLLPGVADGPWERIRGWISDRIADTWKSRGPYPGIGAALAGIGFEKGAILAHRVMEAMLDPDGDPFHHLDIAIRDSAEKKGPGAGLVGRMGLPLWKRLSADKDRLDYLKLLARIPLTTAQATRLLQRQPSGGGADGPTPHDYLQNPYLIFETDRGRIDSISLATVDRSLFPHDAQVRAVLARTPLSDPVADAADDRRVRAATVHILETAAGQGHTLLDETGIRRRLGSLNLDPPCDPTDDLFDIATDNFSPALESTPLANDRGRGWQLGWAQDATVLIREAFQRRLGSSPFPFEWEWRSRIDDALGSPASPNDTQDQAARQEKAEALEVLARSRVSALVGPAGTGKTTMLQALCSHDEIRTNGVLLLAPTGKARVQLGDRVGAIAQTLAQFLRSVDRWHPELGYRIVPGARRIASYRTVVVDEASMLTERMLAALIDALEGVDRLVLCGDHRQLPPIGEGRPFSDLVKHLEKKDPDEPGGGLAILTVSMRQKGSGGRNDALSVASLFSVDNPWPAADEALARVLRGEGDGSVELVSWTDEVDLHRKIERHLEGSLQIDPAERHSLQFSFGAAENEKGWPVFPYGAEGAGAENWQILSPVRARSGGINGLNRFVHARWRPGDAQRALKSRKLPRPMGSSGILTYDKVMCVQNNRRNGWDTTLRKKVDGAVANGEIGVVVGWPDAKSLNVGFSTQPGVRFTFWESDFGTEQGKELLELAYAITIHKSQGSQFLETLVVIPNPCPLLSPELLYTALTRQQNRAVVFYQGDYDDFRVLGDPSRSATAKRLTCLLRDPDPYESPEGVTFDAAHVHRTSSGDMVRSKSEVIVAETLFRLKMPFVYEEVLMMPDGTQRLPDFTIRMEGIPTVYWEHLGMLGSAGYRSDWEAKKAWYREHGILPHGEGGGPKGTLVWSEDSRDGRIDVPEIEALAKAVARGP